jgi:hypothetical protein
MIPKPVTLQAFVPPAPMPIVSLEVGITPSARGTQLVILPGSSINGSRAFFSDLHGLSAYAGAGGFQPRNIRTGRRVMLPARGIEDSDTKRSD